MEDVIYNVYARQQDNVVVKIFSDVFEQPNENDILIESGNSEYHSHPHLKYQLTDDLRCHNYKIVDGKIVERTAEEKAEEYKKIQPTEPTTEEKIKELQEELTNTQLALTEIYESMGV